MWIEIALAVGLYFATFFVARQLLHRPGLHRLERFLWFYLLPGNLIFALLELAFRLIYRLWLTTDCRRKRETYFRNFFDFDPFPVSPEKQEKVARKLARDLGDLYFWDFTWHVKVIHENDVPSEILMFIFRTLTEIRKRNGKQELVAMYCGYKVMEQLELTIYPCDISGSTEAS